MTRTLYIVTGALVIILLNFLFVLWLIIVGLVRDFQRGKVKL